MQKLSMRKTKKRNFNNLSGTDGCCWHIFAAFIELFRIIKWKNFDKEIFWFWLIFQHDSTSLSLDLDQKFDFLREIPDPDFPPIRLYITKNTKSALPLRICKSRESGGKIWNFFFPFGTSQNKLKHPSLGLLPNLPSIILIDLTL